ncbi:hypothetical protein GY45DRAFT_1360269 [Cubamyces sp. BRFM 1775]|nr:hypothetical protein GY45DRAFT_1360269 [Cubamyces sp. BRFM 1775]
MPSTWRCFAPVFAFRARRWRRTRVKIGFSQSFAPAPSLLPVYYPPPMSADAAEKPSRKDKKAKANAAVDSETTKDHAEKPRKSKKGKKTDQAGTEELAQPLDDDTSSPVAEVAKSEKQKKRKKREHAAEEDANRTEDEPKKKKKRKHDERAASPEAAAPPPTDPEAEAGPSQTEAVAGKKAKSKKKKGKEAAKEGEEGDAASAGKKDEAGGDVDPAAQSEGRAVKEVKGKKDKKDKKKKRKKGADDERDDAEGQKEAESSSKPRKKRKRASKCGLPDPTDDEALTEQAQKALHYAFTQFEEPESWKFNKARQNWIIRNVWSEQAIPETYLPLVHRYLQGVQGGSREHFA